MIDREWNIWKQAAEIVNSEREIWRYHPIAEELITVSAVLMQLGYLTPAKRSDILRLINRYEQAS